MGKRRVKIPNPNLNGPPLPSPFRNKIAADSGMQIQNQVVVDSPPLKYPRQDVSLDQRNPFRKQWG
jgi:hypothetical protein